MLSSLTSAAKRLSDYQARAQWPLRYLVTSCLGLLAVFLLSSACTARPAPEFTELQPVLVTVAVGGETRSLTTSAANVREFLEEASITLNDADLIEPPLFTPLTNGMSIAITRVTESIEVIEQSIPYQRRTVRNESMQAEDPPVIVQTGRPGLQELTVRIVYHDGLEFSRQDSRLTIIEPAQDEIVMVGVGAAPGTVEFDGLLAYVAGGNSILMRGSSAFPEQINTGGDLDRRVYELSPSGAHLLYTRATTDTERFNSLWLVSTLPGAEPRPVGVDNVLWAAWNPDRASRPQIAFTTGIPTELLPGWEANNDLWLMDLPASPTGAFRPEEFIEAYPATYGWWGGEYAWSPVGRYIAYSHADEVGVIDTQAGENERRVQLHSFTEYNTQADWVWVPSLSWSPDGRFVAFSKHAGDDPEALLFDTWVVDVETGVAARFVQQSGIWGYPQWSPSVRPGGPSAEEASDSRIAFLRATDPVESLRSSYTLWLMDRDGSNARQIYPAAGENSRFPREQSALAWGPAGDSIVFVYDGDLFLFALEDGPAQRITHDDNVVSNPSRAPYGRAWREGQSDLEQSPDAATATVEPGTGPPQ